MGDTPTDFTNASGGSEAALPSGPSSGGAASSLAGLGLGFKAYADIVQGQGTKAADVYKAETLERAAQYGELKATQTNAEMTRNLTITLGNIDAVRAAAHTDPTSPTGVAVRDYAEQTATEQKNIKVDSITAQVGEDEANAAYLRKAGSAALLAGDISAGADVVTGIGKAIAGAPGG